MIILRQKTYAEKKKSSWMDKVINTLMSDPEKDAKKIRESGERRIQRATSENPSFFCKLRKKVDPKFGTTEWVAKKRREIDRMASSFS